jgi:hypothetical protein
MFFSVFATQQMLFLNFIEVERQLDHLNLCFKNLPAPPPFLQIAHFKYNNANIIYYSCYFKTLFDTGYL